jgi:hypothetical protein
VCCYSLSLSLSLSLYLSTSVNREQGSYLPFLSNLYPTEALRELRFDRSRNTLYALTATSAIQCYWLGKTVVHFAQHFCVTTKPDANIVKKASMVCRLSASIPARIYRTILFVENEFTISCQSFRLPRFGP